MAKKRIKKPVRRKKKSDYPGEMSFRKGLSLNPVVMQGGGTYNMQRALELGYTPDETGHWPSVDSTNGMWLKSKQHPSAWMEYMYGYALNPENNRRFDVVPNVEGYFGDNQLQYVDKKQNGGPADNIAYDSPEYRKAYAEGKLVSRLNSDPEDFVRAGMLPEYTFDYKRKFSDLPKPRYKGWLISQQLIDENAKKEYEQREKAIDESVAVRKNPFSAERLARESAATGDKLSLQMNLGDPYNNPRLYEALGALDYFNPAVMVGDFATGLGSIPYNIQEGNYGAAALSLVTPLATGALASIGVKTPRGFINNLVNPFAGIGDAVKTPVRNATRLRNTPRQLPGSSNVDGVGKLNFSSKLNQTKDRLSKAIKGTTSTLQEIKGELLQGKVNRESIKKGNEWLENWIKHPATKEKINTDIDARIDFVKQFYDDPIREVDLLNLIRTQSRNFKPNSKEYSLLKQLDNNLQQYLSKKSIDPIHQGNWGVSYQHGYTPKDRKAVEEGLIKPSDRYGSWISRTTKLPQDKRISTTIHEGTHDWVSGEAFKKSGMRNTALQNMNPKIKNDFLEWERYRESGIDPVKNMGKERAYQAYLADPTEQHARIMELRYQLGITPDYKMDLEDAKKVLEWIDKGGSKIDPQFLNVIDKDPKKLADLFNRFWMAPAAIGAGTYGANQMQNAQPTIKKQRGGSLTTPTSASFLNRDRMRRGAVDEPSVFEDVMAGLYGVGEGLLDAATMGATDELTDMGFKALQGAADTTGEAAQKQQGYAGVGNAVGAIGGAALGITSPEQAVTQSIKGAGKAVSGFSGSPEGDAAGQAIQQIPGLMGNFKDMKTFMASRGGRFRYQQGGQMLNQNLGLTEIGGPSHAEGGVTLPNNGQGPDVEVEGPETIYTPENYVMSEKIKASKTALREAGISEKYAGKSYADISKAIKKQGGDKLRPNDKLTLNFIDSEMKKLIKAHDIDRQLQEQKNVVAATPEEQQAGYNMYPDANSIAFPGSGPTQVVPTNNNDPIMVTGADGSQQMLVDQPIQTQAPFVEEKMARGGQMIKRADGSYSRRGLWDNIRANRGSGKKPTKQMLEQERKIKAAEKAYGGYYAEGGSFDNPGFRALPEYVQAKIKSNMEVGGYMDYDDTMEYGKGGYTVRRSNDRKGKTHVVTGPDGTKKYFGDPKLGERGKSKYGKKAFYARHKKNLAKNPYFRAYARATWEDGGYMDMEPAMYNYGGPMMYAQGGIHIDPSKRGTFKAQASKMGMGVQEAASTILNAPEGKYSSAMRKKANFARNFAKEDGGYYQMGGDMMQPQQMPQQGGGQEEAAQQIIQQVAQMLQQNVAPEQVVGKLIEMGVPQQQAVQMVEMVAQQMQGQQQPAMQQQMPQPPGMMRYGGKIRKQIGGKYFNQGVKNALTMIKPKFSTGFTMDLDYKNQEEALTGSNNVNQIYSNYLGLQEPGGIAPFVPGPYTEEQDLAENTFYGENKGLRETAQPSLLRLKQKVKSLPLNSQTTPIDKSAVLPIPTGTDEFVTPDLMSNEVELTGLQEPEVSPELVYNTFSVNKSKKPKLPLKGPKDYKSPMGTYIAGAAGSMVGPLSNIAAAAFAPDPTYAAAPKLQRYDYTPVALQQAAGNQALANTREGFRRGAPTQGSYLSNMAVASPSMAMNLGEALAKTRYGIDTSNIGIANQEAQLAAAQAEKNALLKDQSIANRWQLGMKGAEGIGNNVQGFSKDMGAKRMQDMIVNSMKTGDFSIIGYDMVNGQLIPKLAPSGLATYENIIETDDGKRYKKNPDGTYTILD